MTDATFSLAMWGERGLVATLFFDVNAAGAPGWQQLLEAAGLTGPLCQGSAITGVRLIVEPDFGAFGKPDAIVRLDLSDGSRRVLIVEAKRGLWSKAATIAAHRGGEAYNSKLNGQLELNHALVLALSSFREGAPELAEPDWIAHTPYSMDRRGARRALKNAAVLQDVVAQYAGLDFRQYFHLIVTADTANPTERADLQVYMPEIYHPEFPFKNAWLDLKGQFGWLSWSHMESVIQALQRSGALPHASYFATTVALNRRNMGASASEDPTDADEERIAEDEGDTLFASPSPNIGLSGTSWSAPGSSREPKSLEASGGIGGEGFLAAGAPHKGPLPGRSFKGVSLIYAPRLNSRTFVHFSWEGESCRLRDYSGRAIPQAQNPGKRSMVERHIEYEVQVPRRGHPTGDAEYWYRQIKDLNERYVARRP